MWVVRAPQRVVFVTAARADCNTHTAWLCGAGVFPPPPVIVPAPKAWCHNPPFALGETEALRWLRLRSQKSSPVHPASQGQAAPRWLGPQTQRSVLTARLCLGPCEPHSGAELPALAHQTPECVASPLPVNSNNRPSCFLSLCSVRSALDLSSIFPNRDLRRPATLADRVMPAAS